jgi:hypothetical protein
MYLQSIYCSHWWQRQQKIEFIDALLCQNTVNFCIVETVETRTIKITQGKGAGIQ